MRCFAIYLLGSVLAVGCAQDAPSDASADITQTNHIDGIRYLDVVPDDVQEAVATVNEIGGDHDIFNVSVPLVFRFEDVHFAPDLSTVTAESMHRLFDLIAGRGDGLPDPKTLCEDGVFGAKGVTVEPDVLACAAFTVEELQVGQAGDTFMKQMVDFADNAIDSSSPDYADFKNGVLRVGSFVRSQVTGTAMVFAIDLQGQNYDFTGFVIVDVDTERALYITTSYGS